MKENSFIFLLDRTALYITVAASHHKYFKRQTSTHWIYLPAYQFPMRLVRRGGPSSAQGRESEDASHEGQHLSGVLNEGQSLNRPQAYSHHVTRSFTIASHFIQAEAHLTATKRPGVMCTSIPFPFFDPSRLSRASEPLYLLFSLLGILLVPLHLTCLWLSSSLSSSLP